MKKNILFVLTVLLVISCKKEVTENTILQGAIFGTYYRVIYDSEINYQKEFDSLFYVINKSLSTYQTNSIVSKINKNEWTHFDDHFVTVFQSSKKIYKETNGAFDPTIGVMVNAWDFGPEGKIKELDSLKVDSLMLAVGFDRIVLPKEKFKMPKNTFLDFNAIAKGYAVDVISGFLQSKKAKNHLVDIGGEIRASGINIEKKSAWRVGIENPNFDGTQSTNHIFNLTDKAMATSGTYRKFKIDENGNRDAHIINTKTGYPSKTNLLSISVIADNCMTADAYATAFKVMGIEKVKAFLKTHPELQVYLIFENENQELETLALNNFPES